MDDIVTIRVKTEKAALEKARFVLDHAGLSLNQAIAMLIKEISKSKRQHLPIKLILDKDRSYIEKQLADALGKGKRYVNDELVKLTVRRLRRWEKAKSKKS